MHILVFEYYFLVLAITYPSFLRGIINITTTGAQDPAQAMQMLQNPMVQQMMQQMLSDPQALEQVRGYLFWIYYFFCVFRLVLLVSF